jgi:hypothetical protein
MGVVSGAVAGAGGRVTGVVPYAFVVAGGEGDKTGAPASAEAARAMRLHEEGATVRQGSAGIGGGMLKACGPGTNGHRRLDARAKEGDGKTFVWFRRFARRLRHVGRGLYSRTLVFIADILTASQLVEVVTWNQLGIHIKRKA